MEKKWQNYSVTNCINLLMSSFAKEPRLVHTGPDVASKFTSPTHMAAWMVTKQDILGLVNMQRTIAAEINKSLKLSQALPSITREKKQEPHFIPSSSIPCQPNRSKQYTKWSTNLVPCRMANLCKLKIFFIAVLFNPGLEHVCICNTVPYRRKAQPM